MRRTTNARKHSVGATLRRIARDHLSVAVKALSENGHRFSPSDRQVLSSKYGISVQALSRDRLEGLFSSE
jgi:hypothetical protein